MRKDQNYIRVQNTKMLLDIIIEKRPISRADIAKESGMSPTSITRAVSFLIELGIIRETGIYSTGVGRRAVMLDLVADSFYTVGLSIAKDSLEMCILNMEYSVVALQSLPVSVKSFSPEEVAQEAFYIYKKLLSIHNLQGSRVIGMGVCVGGVVQNEIGIVTSSRLGWQHVDLSSIFKKIFNLPVLVENVIKSCIIGEKYLYQISSRLDSSILVINSEVSAASTSAGNLIRGRKNAAGYLGHTVVSPDDDTVCSCGRKGCLQTFLTDEFLLKRANAFDSNINSIKEILEFSNKGVPWAVDIMQEFKNKLCLTLNIMTNAYNSSIIFLDGSVVHDLKDIVYDLSQKFTTDEYTELPTEKIIIVDSDKKPYILGCAIMASLQFIYLLLEKENPSLYEFQIPLSLYEGN